MRKKNLKFKNTIIKNAISKTCFQDFSCRIPLFFDISSAFYHENYDKNNLVRPKNNSRFK